MLEYQQQTARPFGGREFSREYNIKHVGITPHTEQHVMTLYVMLPHHHKKRTSF
jgi:hypothetical protein